MTQSWKDLPTETLLRIAHFLPKDFHKSISNFALVCRNWNVALTHHLYAEVLLDTYRNLPNFNRTIVENTNLAIMVKKVACYGYYSSDGVNMSTLLCNLPSLQHFSSNIDCSLPIIDALLDSKLNNLTVIEGTESFSDNYVTCALLLRIRLRKLILGNPGTTFDRLYDKLHQFKKLEEIQIQTISAKPIEKLDSIIEKCASLREVKVKCEQSSWVHDSAVPSVDVSKISSVYTPRPEISTLHITGLDYNMHNSLLVYIMHKFPKLEKLQISVRRMEAKDELTLERLMKYVSEIKHFTLETVHTNGRWVCDSVGVFWELSRSHQPDVLVNLRLEPSSDLTSAAFKFKSIPGAIETTIFHQPRSRAFECEELFDIYGEHVEKVQFYRFRRSFMIVFGELGGATTMEAAIYGCITSCKDLKKLSFVQSNIHRVKDELVAERDFLDELSFVECFIGYRVFDILFSGIKHIGSLTLVDCKMADEPKKMTSSVIINMPDTVLKNVSIKNPLNPRRGVRLTFVSISKMNEEESRREENYYKYDFDLHNDYILKASNELEYNDEKNSRYAHFRICCSSITSLQITYEGHTREDHTLRLTEELEVNN